MTDYPDWSRLIQVVGSDIMIPIDIQGAYIMMPVDIQGQYVDLDVAITAKNIASIMLALTAETMENIKIDINTQTIEDLNINIDAQNIGVQLQPDWQALQGNHKFFRVTASNQARSASAAANYTVTAQKTLYITHFGGSIYATAAADADKDQVCYMNIMNNTTEIILAELGGDGGGGMVLPTPVKIPGGEVFRYQIWNWANHNCEIFFTAGGYEI